MMNREVGTKGVSLKTAYLISASPILIQTIFEDRSRDQKAQERRSLAQQEIFDRPSSLLPAYYGIKRLHWVKRESGNRSLPCLLSVSIAAGRWLYL